jgi:hypothetical protein
VIPWAQVEELKGRKKIEKKKENFPEKEK